MTTSVKAFLKDWMIKMIPTTAIVCREATLTMPSTCTKLSTNDSTRRTILNHNGRRTSSRAIPTLDCRVPRDKKNSVNLKKTKEKVIKRLHLVLKRNKLCLKARRLRGDPSSFAIRSWLFCLIRLHAYRKSSTLPAR